MSWIIFLYLQENSSLRLVIQEACIKIRSRKTRNTLFWKSFALIEWGNLNIWLKTGNFTEPTVMSYDVYY